MEHLTGGGQGHLPRGAPDKLIAEQTFKLFDAPAQGALIDGQPVRGAPKAQLDRDDIECLNISGIGESGQIATSVRFIIL
nr:hypothetical protein [Thalassorhabdomicrobium marinisediminis]